ncbi:MAG: malate synthase A [Woeseiaceae bacterium]|nr:malate synthase A [Woeseiaceae bacterium]
MNNQLEIIGAMTPAFESILTEDALAFVQQLIARFGGDVEEILKARGTRQAAIDGGELPDFLAETKAIREDNWQVCNAPPDLQDRRVQIVGPTDRKMIINALNSGAQAFMADCEDSLSPTWENVLQGQINLRDTVARRISLDANGKQYALNPETATLIVCPRGWHLVEKNLQLDGEPVSGPLVDFGLFLFHNASEAGKQGTGPYFYLPKMESHREARLWAEIFRFSEEAGIVEPDQIRVTVLIETLPAAFEIDEILYELKDYIVGLSCGHWNYIFSFIKTFCARPEYVLPDRAEISMTTHFLRSYSQLLIKTCKRRGAQAIGFMTPQIPIKNDPDANDIAFARVRADKEREVTDGHDGTSVAHPDLVALATEIFDRYMPDANQLNRSQDDVGLSADDLLQVPRGKITEAGFRENIRVAIEYMAAWMGGNGRLARDNLMEDLTTAEISRAQLWQWIHQTTGILDEGQNVSVDLFKTCLQEELAGIKVTLGDVLFETGGYRDAAGKLEQLSLEDAFVPFLTTMLYDELD